MSATPLKTQASSSPEQGTLMSTRTPAQSSPQSIAPPTGVAKLMADHSDDEQDPMIMAQIGLGQNVWEDDEENDEPTHSSPTPAKALDGPEDFEILGDEEIPKENDMAYIHEQHIRAMMHHRVPDYPIPPKHASPIGLDDGGREGQLRRYNLFIEECYPIDRWPVKNAMNEDFEDSPRHGSPNRYLRIIHIKGETLEVHKENWRPCDRTCPLHKKTFLEKVAAASGKFLGLR